MRVAGRLAADVLDMIDAHIVPGVTTDELDRICHEFIVHQQRSVPANLGYNGFPKTICTSVNHVVCHGIPNDRKLRAGDIINIDVTVIHDGFHGDTSRMYFVGKPPVIANAWRASQDAMWARIRVVRPGTRLGDVATPSSHWWRPTTFPSCANTAAMESVACITRIPGAALRGTGLRRCAADRHDLHHRTHDQCRQAARAAAEGRLDCRHQGSFAVRAMGSTLCW
jgi:hypothetical protein